MSWRTVFEDDLLSVRRSRLGLGVSLSLIVLTGGLAVLVSLIVITAPSDDPMTLETLLYSVGSVVSLILPFVAMMGSYSSIVHEREHGSIRFLLGLPNSRSDAYLGKLLSRSTLFTIPTVVGMGVIAAIGFALLAEPSALQFAAIAVLVLVYGLIFTGFGLSLSAITDNETSATSGVIGVWMAFRLGWMGLQYGALYLIVGRQFSQPYPEWYYWLGRINPMNAYIKLVYEALNTPAQRGRVLITNPRPSVDTVATSSEFAAVVLVAWLVIAPLVGYLRFRNTDLL